MWHVIQVKQGMWVSWHTSNGVNQLIKDSLPLSLTSTPLLSSTLLHAILILGWACFHFFLSCMGFSHSSLSHALSYFSLSHLWLPIFFLLHINPYLLGHNCWWLQLHETPSRSYSSGLSWDELWECLCDRWVVLLWTELSWLVLVSYCTPLDWVELI
jgi:hypothetical protein